MTPKLNTVESVSSDAPDDFDEIMELTQKEKRELLDMWKARQYEKI